MAEIYVLLFLSVSNWYCLKVKAISNLYFGAMFLNEKEMSELSTGQCTYKIRLSAKEVKIVTDQKQTPPTPSLNHRQHYPLLPLILIILQLVVFDTQVF